MRYINFSTAVVRELDAMLLAGLLAAATGWLAGWLVAGCAGRHQRRTFGPNGG